MRFLLQLLLRSLGHLRPGERIVRVKSLRPECHRDRVEWPVLLIEKRGGQRATVSPIFERRKR